MLNHLMAAVAILALASTANAEPSGDKSLNIPTRTDRVAVNGVQLHYEVHGEGPPLLMLHGGVNPSEMFGAPLAEMAKSYQVIAVHLRGHGLSTDSHEPWSHKQMADDVAALLAKLGFDKIDIMGWSLGGKVALQTAIHYPERVGKLVVIGVNIKDTGNFPEVQAAFDRMPEMAQTIAGNIKQSPLGELYPSVDWETVMRKTGEMNQVPYDWSDDVATIAAPTLLIFADADTMYPTHIAEIYGLFGGGTQDAGIDGSTRPTSNQLAIIPGTTHYEVMTKATDAVTGFAKAFLKGSGR